MQAKPLFLLFFSALVLYTLGNSSLPLIDRDEPRFAEASREMWQSGDFLLPRLNGQYRFDKPPLIYWSQVLAFHFLGDNDFAARLPSALFAALTGVVTAAFGARVAGERTGLWAGLIFTSSLQVFIHAKAAVADMALVLFFVLAAWACWERIRFPSSKFWWWLFYLSLGLGFLAKGPVALLPTLFRPIHSLLGGRPFKFNIASALGGMLVLAAVIGSWGIPAILATHGEYARVGLGKHVWQRSLQPMESHGGPGFAGYLLFLPYYLIAAFFSFFPWCIFLPAGLKRLWHERDSDENYLTGAILLVVFVFTLIQTKLPHYVLPAYPALAILVARKTEHIRWRPIVLALAVTLELLLATVGFKLIEPQFLSKSIAREALPLISPETRTASVHYDEQSLIWYLRSKVRPYHVRLEPKDFNGFMELPGPALCVVNPQGLSSLPMQPDWHTFRNSGYNFARWKVKPAKLLGIQIPLPFPDALELITVIKD